MLRKVFSIIAARAIVPGAIMLGVIALSTSHPAMAQSKTLDPCANDEDPYIALVRCLNTPKIQLSRAEGWTHTFIEVMEDEDPRLSALFDANEGLYERLYTAMEPVVWERYEKLFMEEMVAHGDFLQRNYDADTARELARFFATPVQQEFLAKVAANNNHSHFIESLERKYSWDQTPAAAWNDDLTESSNKIVRETPFSEDLVLPDSILDDEEEKRFYFLMDEISAKVHLQKPTQEWRTKLAVTAASVLSRHASSGN